MKQTLFFLLSLLTLQTAFSQIPNNGLVVHYPVNGNIDDVSSNGYNGTIVNAQLVSDRFGNSNSALEFNGVNGEVQLPSSPALKPNFPFTLSLWFVSHGTSSLSQVMYSSDASISGYSGFWILHTISNNIAAGYGDGAGLSSNNRRQKVSNLSVVQNEWYHVVAVFNGLDDIDLYINCTEDLGSYTGTGATMVDLGDNGAMGRRVANDQLDGLVDDVRLYNRALSEEEINFLCYESPCVEYVTVYDTIVVYDTVQVSISDIVDEETALEVYPNPTSGFMNIEIDDYNLNAEYSMSIVNASGQVVFGKTKLEKHNTINMDGLGAGGAYILNIYDSQDRLIGTRKLLFNRPE